MVVACALALVLGAVCAPPADAYHLGGQRWPGRTITYHNLAPGYAWSLARAVEAWNRSGARLRFVPKPRRKAQVLIHGRGSGSPWGCTGYATIGFVPRVIGGGHVYIQRRCGRFIGAGILAHELGHVLGLDHEDRRCATMNSVLWARCGDPGLDRWHCRLVERDDARGAVRRYGGSVKDREPQFCWDYPPPPPPGQIVITPNPPSGADALITWKNTSNPGVSRVLIVRKRDSCPTDEADGDESFQVGASPRSNDSYEDQDADGTPLEPGDYCYALWSYDAHDRTAGPATKWMTYVDVFPSPSGVSAQLSPPSGASVKLSWTSSPNPHATAVVVLRREGTCPVSPEDPDAWFVDWVVVAPGQPGVSEDWEELSGSWCYALWSSTVSGDRYSRAPATVVVDFP